MTPRTAFFPLLTVALSLACGDKAEEDFVGGGGSLDDSDDSGDTDDSGDSGDTDDSGDTADDTDDGLPPLQEACAGGEDGTTEPVVAIELSSSMTWTLEFDDDAEADGMEDCTYSREFSGTQVLDRDYLCPDCDFIVTGPAVMTEGYDCFSQISTDAADRTEAWGIGDGLVLYRSGAEQLALGELATLVETSGGGTEVAVGWESTSALSGGGEMVLTATGTLSWATSETTFVDPPFGPREAAYACGWECNDPGDLEQSYDLAVGAVMPNVRLEDQCGELVDLWDFYGSYLILDTSQEDCGPCRSMAAAEEAFIQEMREAGIPVRVITMMGNGLSEPYGTPSSSTVDNWIASYGLTDPVLYDRGYAYALFPDFIEAYSGESFGYPAWLVIDPEMRIVHGSVGFGTWDDMSDVIVADLAR